MKKRKSVFSIGGDGTVIIHRVEKHQYKEIIHWIKENGGLQLGQGADFSRWEVPNEIKLLLYLKWQ